VLGPTVPEPEELSPPEQKLSAKDTGAYRNSMVALEFGISDGTGRVARNDRGENGTEDSSQQLNI
jgi:hypothetical protein